MVLKFKLDAMAGEEIYEHLEFWKNNCISRKKENRPTSEEMAQLWESPKLYRKK